MSSTRQYYTDDERLKIVHYIIEKEAFYCLRGVKFWKELEAANITTRTWQSMKEHFRMNIIRNLFRFSITDKQRKQIFDGFSKTECNERNGEKHDVSEEVDMNFSDEENIQVSSSDNSEDLVIDINTASTSKRSKKEFKKQTLKRKTIQKPPAKKRKSSHVLEATNIPQNTKTPTEQQNNMEINELSRERNSNISSSLNISSTNVLEATNIPQATEIVTEQQNNAEIDELSAERHSDISLSLNVSSTNLDETCVEFSLADDKKFLEGITKDKSNLKSCATVVTFIKQYAEHNNINRNWIDIYDRFIEILNNLELFTISSERIKSKLQKLKEPLEKYRADGFKEPPVEIVSVRSKNETFRCALAPEPDVMYIREMSLNMIKWMEEIKSAVYVICQRIAIGELPESVAYNVYEKIEQFINTYSPESLTTQQTDNINEEVKQEVQIKEETPESDNISIQPEIVVNNTEIQSSQYLEPLTTEELNVTNIVENMIDDGDTTMEFLTCQSDN